MGTEEQDDLLSEALASYAGARAAGRGSRCVFLRRVGAPKPCAGGPLWALGWPGSGLRDSDDDASPRGDAGDFDAANRGATSCGGESHREAGPFPFASAAHAVREPDSTTRALADKPCPG